MTAKEWLSQYRSLDQQISTMMERVQRMRSMLTRSTQQISDMPRGGGQSDWTDTVANLVEADRELCAMIDHFVEMQRAILSQINQITDPAQRTLLEFRYLRGWSWNRISIYMECDRKTCWRIHGSALTNIHPPEE